MKVILTADVKGQGKKGQMINASDGYARNFLLPKGLAIVADKSAMTELESKQSAAAYHKEQEKKQAMELAEKLNEAVVTFTAKAGENGKLFGSITAKDVAEELKMQCHLVIDKKKIQLPDGIKTLGTTIVTVKVYPEITAKIKVNVNAQ
ncbi:MAG: 50S ribosomal protein L9 [Ruminococcaceae bacterium]|nr:50S ribosomal protein L9 [Oscillospiraceae bacterium]